MGITVNPRQLTESGERCLRRIGELNSLNLPSAQFVTAIHTAVEIHISTILGTLIAANTVGNEQFGLALIREIGDDFFRTWDNRYNWLHRGFGIGVRGTTYSQRFQSVVELRNGVIHGDERLTGYQQKNFTKALELRRNLRKHLTVDAVGKFSYAATTNFEAMEVARDFVSGFDATVRAQYPSIR